MGQRRLEGRKDNYLNQLQLKYLALENFGKSYGYKNTSLESIPQP